MRRWGPAEEAEVPLAGNFPSAELLEVRGGPLRIQQREIAFPQQTDERGQRHLGGIGLPVKHRFAEERPANRDAVEPAHEFAIP